MPPLGACATCRGVNAAGSALVPSRVFTGGRKRWRRVAVAVEKEQSQAEGQARAEEKRPVVVPTGAFRCQPPVAERQGVVLVRAKEGLGDRARARPEAVRLVVAGPRLPPRPGE